MRYIWICVLLIMVLSCGVVYSCNEDRSVKVIIVAENIHKFAYPIFVNGLLVGYVHSGNKTIECNVPAGELYIASHGFSSFDTHILWTCEKRVEVVPEHTYYIEVIEKFPSLVIKSFVVYVDAIK